METNATLLSRVERAHPDAPELHQAVAEVAGALGPIRHAHPEWQEVRVLERLVEPDRIVSFRVVWEDDRGRLQLERGYRVQQSNLLGPYKGGLRFRDGLKLGTLRFLAFEQVFKDALTGLPLGGAKGGATFNPRGRSDREIQRFCRAFMTQLHRHIGPSLDVPAGDIGVGARELGYLYGTYRRLGGGEQGALTGKSVGWGGIPLRPEATGYGLVYFLRAAIEQHDLSLAGLRCAISGAGSVAIHAARKLLALDAQVISLSNSDGTLFCPDGFTASHLADIIERQGQGDRLDAIAPDLSGAEFRPGAKPWAEACDVALPCATQNEVTEADAETLLRHDRFKVVAEGANMPCTAAAVAAFSAARRVVYLPGKAANAGGVVVSGLEMAMNAQREPWTEAEVDEALQERMKFIHRACVDNASRRDPVDYAEGANVAAFRRLAPAMLAQGWG